MRKNLLVLFCCLTIGFNSKMLAQTELLHNFITETNQSFENGVITDGTYLYGTKWDGGEHGKGYIYRVKNDNSDFTILISFDGENSGTGGCGSLVLKNDTLYGTTYRGGAYDFGTLFKIKTDGTGYNKLFDFSGSNGLYSSRSLTIDDNTLYGVSNLGEYSYGSIFKINTNGDGFETLFSFDKTNGWNPSSPLTKQGDFLYGTTSRGGANDHGVIYKIRSNGEDFTVLKDDFPGHIGCMPNGNLVVINSSIYGTTSQGGIGSAGFIYKIKTDGSSFQVINDFANYNGSNPVGLVSYGSDIYGMTVNGGYRSGIIYKVDTTENNFLTLHQFDKHDGANPFGVLNIYNDKLYGYANNGAYNYGVVFSINPDGSDFTKIIDIQATNDGYSSQGALVVTPSKCYGFTNGGGVYNSGVIYSLDPDGLNYQVIHNFTGNDGADPVGSMVLSNDTLFGMTNLGGNYGEGAVFSYALESNNYNKIFDFDYANGNYPTGSVCMLGSKIYGVAGSGGNDNKGVLFKMNTDGTHYDSVFDFAGTGITRPQSTIIHVDSVFYGLALNDSTGILAVYSIRSDGTEFNVLYESNEIDAGQYGESIVTDSTYLYAITKQGGENDLGVLFKIKKDGTEFSKLLDFDWSIGASPQAPLLLVDSVLYISTSFGGPGGVGGVVGIKTDGTDFKNIIDYSELYMSNFKRATNTKKLKRGHDQALLKSTLSGSTIGGLTFNNNKIYLVSDQTIDEITQGSLVKYILTALGNNDIYTKQHLNVYPNPAVNHLVIEHDKPQVRVQIFNISGRKMLEQTLYGKVLNIDQLLPGMYILSIDNITTKFIKE
jgi:uncharacterized repeat protein (TIGR03803 family)